MTSSPQSKNWMEFLDDNLLDDPAQPNSLFWCSLNEQADLSANNSSFCIENSDEQERATSRKRPRDDSTKHLPSKACREKMRRDRLNDRFAELSTLLDQGRAPKTDKILILADALTTLNQLKMEAQQLSSANEKLRETIKELKAEKSELRDEKQRLKSEKERLEQQIKTMTLPGGGFMQHPAAMHAAMMAYAAQNAGNKYTSMPGYPGMGMGMWQWMPPAALDTSQDHMLRPPVA
ncbi:hypothetical protein KP509_02G070400 [Ceratopteris richardii]|uniref:BHLH domain-containing protein n=1 Tax=Ceratopteris richardii TaxID=49495 RepID=A0A8T2VA14_CERRI|nr:hypothetical protein KP509_02G070400 [Ceratopteris richardii]